MARFKAISELCNVVSLAAYCVDDSSMMLVLENITSELWLPSVKVQEGESWQSVLTKELLEIFEVEMESTKLLKIYKLWLPEHVTNWIYHCVYCMNVSEDIKRKSKTTRGRYRARVRWVTEQELIKAWLNGNLRTPELLLYFRNLRAHNEFPYTPPQELITQAPEYIAKGKLVEISKDAFVNPGKNLYEQLIEAAGFNTDMQKYLYREFIFFSFPAVYISQISFIRFIMDLGWSREDAPNVFRAADVTDRCGLSYREFLFILAAVEPYTTHGGAPAEIRCRYMFRFFDMDRDGILNLTEFRNFIAYMRKSKSLPADLVEIMKDADTIYKNLGFSSITPLTVGAFLVAVGTLKIRGTSHIFRSVKSAQQYIQGILKREIRYKASDTMVSKKSAEFVLKAKTEEKQYELAAHTVRLQKSATLINVEELWNMQNAISQTALSIVQTSTPEQCRRTSIAIFNQESECNELLKSIRYLQQLNKFKTYAKGKPLFSWGHLDPELFGRHLMNVCDSVTEILKKEPRLLNLSSPIYIMGDLHGNIGDLMYFEKVFWNLGPCLSPCNLLFLGDFVDRGAYGIEVITYLFCYKMQTPQKVWLLRGNHEIKDIQKMFSFQVECINKFGDKTGLEVWDTINRVFDCMPLSAIIDGKIFCVHGGIPPPWLCPVVSAINQIPVPLDQPDVQSPLAWELMWNDPLKKNAVTDTVTMELSANDGFATNYRRGTAHVFSVEALERFLHTNNFSHLVRAHEVAQSGFNIQQKAKLLTVFSSSKYCGGANEAACILADRGKLRIMRLETDS